MEAPNCLLAIIFLTATFAVHAQDDQSGFISLDCGSLDNYTDTTTGINYLSDSTFIDGGDSKSIPAASSVEQRYKKVRAFPQGTRNCYTLRPAQGKGNKYLIRASFLYGNYDSLNQLPAFDLHLGADHWLSIDMADVDTPGAVEIIHILPQDHINVCLVKTGSSTPFISSLEIRPMNSILYVAKSGSLQLLVRYNFNYETTQAVRYRDDLRDRIWFPFTDALNESTTISTSSNIVRNDYELPNSVMSSAVTHTLVDGAPQLQVTWESGDASEQYYVYTHFADLELLQANQSRRFNIYINDDYLFYADFAPSYLSTNTLFSKSPINGSTSYNISLIRVATSTHPPIINAMEVYSVKQFLHMETDDTEVSAMLKIKTMYGIRKNWQGDPCAPQDFSWEGLDCSYDGFLPPKIKSLNLSGSSLYGVIAPSIYDLSTLQTLDLSNNNLTGVVPDFLGLMTSLTNLNLQGNNFTGSIPATLLDKENKGLLILSIEGTRNITHTCRSRSCKKTTEVLIPAIASAAAVFLVLCVTLITICKIKKRKRKDSVYLGRKVDSKSIKQEGKLATKNRQFTYSEVLNITNNFEKVIGKGGFGTVYHGYVGNIQVAVKMLSPSSTQGYKEFQAEASLLMSVYHKNLSTLVGYCNEGTNMGIIYEFMANGNLDQHLSDTNLYTLDWEERIRIAIDAAQGLEYLHHSCKPPIVHRDVKSNNILLNENSEAKLTDFGLSRAFSVEGNSHISTVVAGTPGYLDPEYYTSNRLTEKSDVYGFGVVLLEILTGRPAISRNEARTHIIQWVTTTINNGDVSDIVDPRLKGDFDINSAWKLMELAMVCASRVSMERPTMKEVVLELNACLETEKSIHQNDEVSYKESIALMSVNIDSGHGPGAR